MKQFIWTYGRRNIITYPRLKHKMLKFQFMIVRMNVTRHNIKGTNRNKFKSINIPNYKSSLRFWFLPQQRTIWSNVTNNTTKVTGKHKNCFLMQFTSKFGLRFRNFSVYIRTFKSAIYDFVAATSDLLVLIICRWNSGSDFERRRHNTF